MLGTTSMVPDARMSRAVAGEMEVLARMTGNIVQGAEPSRKRRRTGDAGASVPSRVEYSTLSTALRAVYEDKKDWTRAEPLLRRRKGWRPGQFRSFRMRALQRFALKVCGRGLSREELVELYDLLDIWDRTKPGMPVDDGHMQRLRDVFPSVNSFQDAMSDDVDDAVLNEGWMKVTIEESGRKCVAYFRSALEVALSLMASATDLRPWSGDGKPAEPSAKRETPMEGDAFRMHEKFVCDKHGNASFVLGLHLFSDACQISCSGGTWPGCAGLFLWEMSDSDMCTADRRLTLIMPCCLLFCLGESGIFSFLKQRTSCTPCV